MYLCIVPLYLCTQNVGATIIKAHMEWRIKCWQGGGVSAALAVQISRSAANSKIHAGNLFLPSLCVVSFMYPPTTSFFFLSFFLIPTVSKQKKCSVDRRQGQRIRESVGRAGRVLPRILEWEEGVSHISRVILVAKSHDYTQGNLDNVCMVSLAACHLFIWPKSHAFSSVTVDLRSQPCSMSRVTWIPSSEVSLFCPPRMYVRKVSISPSREWRAGRDLDCFFDFSLLSRLEFGMR